MSMIADGRTDGLVRRAARWVLRATLGKSSDRGEPECFRPARTLREAPSAEPIERHPLGANSWEPCRWRSALTMSILFRKKGWLTVAQLARAWTAEIPGAEQDPRQFEQELVHLLLEDIVNKRSDDAGPLAEGRRLGLRLITPDGRQFS